MNALLIGNAPPCDLGYTYVSTGPYDGVVIGSLSRGGLLSFSQEAVLDALAEGKPVLLYEPGLPGAGNNRSLAAAFAARRRELKNWGIVFTDGNQKKLITATEAQKLLAAGKQPAAGSVLTPLAKEILEGKT